MQLWTFTKGVVRLFMSFAPPVFRPVVDADGFIHHYYTYPEEPTNVLQSYPPLVSNNYSDSFSPHPIPFMADPEFQSLDDPLEMPNPSYPSYPNPSLNEPTAHNVVPSSSFASEGFQYLSPADSSYLHQADGTTTEALTFPTPSAPPHSSAPLTIQGLPGPTNVSPGAMNAFGPAQAQAPLSTSSTFDGFGGSTATHSAPPVLPATANVATNPPNTVYTCQCVADGSLCNAVMRGSARAVRDHFREGHAFSCVGKDVVVCPWAGCGKPLQRESIPRHIISIHFRMRVRCVKCGSTLSRSDVQYSHAKACRGRRRTASRLDSKVSGASAGQASD